MSDVVSAWRCFRILKIKVLSSISFSQATALACFLENVDLTGFALGTTQADSTIHCQVSCRAFRRFFLNPWLSRLLQERVFSEYCDDKYGSIGWLRIKIIISSYMARKHMLSSFKKWTNPRTPHKSTYILIMIM